MYFAYYCITYSGLLFIGVYVKFDGLMHPELNHNKLKELQQSNEESKQSLWKSITGLFSKIKNYVVPSGDEVETKYFSGRALRIYLSKHHRILTGKVHTKKSPVEIITDIIYMFNSLYQSCLHIDNSCRFLPNSSEIKQVVS